MAKQLLGKEVTEELNQKLKARAAALREKGIIPTLGIVRVGEDPSDIAYEKGAMKRAEMLGVEVVKFELPVEITKEALIEKIEEINRDDRIHGVLMFRPLPGDLRKAEDEICNHLDTKKDIDGITDGSNAGVFMGKAMGFAPCTPSACMEILDYYGIDCTGKRAVVIGRSLVVGKPAAMMLIKKNATVTVCHTKTVDMPGVAREADILIVAAGRAGIVGADYVKPGMVVIDVGINWSEEKQGIVGDVDYAAVEPIVEAITPVPGGVGSVTTSVLIGHCIEAAERTQG
jgi:methylenetetrahydrofolate dehydrogenase (NADP+)/methenyltetrahydrofolate cyclohydrolase